MNFKQTNQLQNLSRTYEIGIVGAGWISTSYHLPILHNMDATSVSYVADINHEQARKASRGYDAEAIEIDQTVSRLPNCDVVVLAIPVGVRQEYIAEFADRGTAVFSEKPFAVDPEMHQKFVTTADVIGCNYMRVHYDATVQLRRALDAGLFGTPERIELVEEGKTGATGLGKDHFQTSSDKSGGGVLLERGCHSLSQISSLFPDYEISVKSAEIIWYEGLDAEVDAELRLSKGDSAIDVDYRISRLRPIGSSLRVDCVSSILTTDPFDPSDPLRIASGSESGSSASLVIDDDDAAATTTHQAMYLRWQEFLSRLVADDIDNDAETMPSVTQVITEIYREAA